MSAINAGDRFRLPSGNVIEVLLSRSVPAVAAHPSETGSGTSPNNPAPRDVAFS